MNLKDIANSFFSSFHSNHVILYVGQNAKNDELRDYIAKCPWSGIITSRRDPEFSSLFANEDRTVYEYSSRAQIPVKPLNRKKMPILRLFGIQGEAKEDEDLAWLRVNTAVRKNAEYDMELAKELLHMLPSLLDEVNPLVIIGATSNIDWELFGTELASLLYREISDGSVSIWDMPTEVAPAHAEAYGILKKVAEKKNFKFHERSLAEIVRSYETETAMDPTEASPLPEHDSDIYYQGRLPIRITQRDLLVFKNMGLLLTERTVNGIRPLGRVLSQKYFSNFLECSAEMGPQWYGYLPNSTFYVKRSYENALVQLVRRMLEGKGINGSAANRPIILSGDPGSSKSITLGALAYRIFNEKVNPVIFISKSSFLSANIGTSFDDLDEAMQLLERKSAVDTRILVIWDSSAYRTGVEQARMLLERLENRGRRFVLVCSSYREGDEGEGYFLCDDGTFVPCGSQTPQVLDRAGFYFVKAIREMDGQEQFEFWKRVKEYSGINANTISQLRKRLTEDGRNEVFDFYYMLISLLRENLERGLRSEQKKVAPYVEKELRKVIGDIGSQASREKTCSSIYQAFLDAGIAPSVFMPEGGPNEDESNNNPSESNLELDKKLDSFNTCIALFSRFKLSVPYGLAYTVLVGEKSVNPYSESSRRLYEIVTTDIPWIYYAEDAEGDFSFRFRNSLEADIFLRNHDITGERQIGLLCEIIDIYGKDYRRNQYIDLAFTDNLQALLRLMGPNSTYPLFQRSSRKYEHNSILEKLDCLIDKLKELRDTYGVPDEDAGFASIIVTFTREYYGTIWNSLYSSPNSERERWEDDPEHFSAETYEFRIEQLSSAIALAESSIEKIECKTDYREISRAERQHLINQRYAMTVEIAQCNMRLEDIVEEYQRCCAVLRLSPKDLINHKLSYQVLYQQLLKVISNNPTSGYAYNALFRAFIRIYEKQILSKEKKLQYLSEIMQVVETCETFDDQIVNRGNRGTDELRDNINRIKDYSTGFQITLASVCRHRRGIPAADENEQICFDLFDEMLMANNAAAITFVCQKELRIPKGMRQLNTDQLLRCRTVYNFMRDEDNFECVRTNAYALAMLIRVCWMLYNETTLTSAPECQLTKLTHAQWLELNQLCAIYKELDGGNKQPLLVLLYAISVLQVSNLAEYGYQEALNILDLINEDMFYQRRMWTPFMLCDETGAPYQFSGVVLSTRDNNGFIRINGIPQRINGKNGVRFRQYNLGRGAKIPKMHQRMDNLELGVGYTGFSVYTQEGRKRKEARA